MAAPPPVTPMSVEVGDKVLARDPPGSWWYRAVVTEKYRDSTLTNKLSQIEGKKTVFAKRDTVEKRAALRRSALIEIQNTCKIDTRINAPGIKRPKMSGE